MSRSNKISVVIDTNVFVSCISRKSVNHLVYKDLTQGYYDLHITNDILLEYEEKISAKYDIETAELFLTALHELPNVFKEEVFFYWNLITEDADDNKFVDCAIISNVDYLVTNDKHFNGLKKLSYPRVNIITVEEFVDVLKTFLKA
jgi:putative PIN family toxin of toxin-antitoxin system